MTPFDETTGSLSGRKGGLVMSPAKRQALRALHDSLRGVRQHGGNDRERATVLADLVAALREPRRGILSIRALASHLRISDGTVRRWLSGEDWPSSITLRAIRSWLKSVQR